MKNYLNLVLTGYTENREFFSEYLISEQKIAERDEFIEDIEFFKRCEDVVLMFNSDIDKQYYARTNELHLLRDGAKSKTIKFDGVDKANEVSYNKKCKDVIENCNNELGWLTRDKFSITLFHLSKGNFKGHLLIKDVDYIENCITNASRYIHYVKRKRFGFQFFEDYKSKDFESFVEKLASYKNSFDFIKNKLQDNEAIEFVCDFMDNLKRLEKYQTQSKFINVISSARNIIKRENTKILKSNIQKSSKPNATVIRRFCELVNDSGLDTKNESSVSDYCMKICKKYDLKYTENVRKYFSVNNKHRELEKVISLIFPLIPKTDKEYLERYINNQKKMYT